jgi:hypothetical protein
MGFHREMLCYNITGKPESSGLGKMSDFFTPRNPSGVGGFPANQSSYPEGQFRPGQSGNPGGKSRSLSVLQIECRKHAIEVVNRLMTIFRTSQNDSCRVAAGREVLDRGFGKAAISVDVDLAVRKQIGEMTLEELAALDAKLAAASTLPAIAYESDEQRNLLDVMESAGDEH